MIYKFSSMEQRFSTIEKVPDQRSEAEKKFTPLSMFNHDKADIGYAERLTEELINISGAWITIFQRVPQTTPPDEAVIWEEDADPVYERGIKVKAYFQPDTIAREVTRWGIDIPLRVKVVFPRAILFHELGSRLVKLGDVLRVPYNAIPDVIPKPRSSPSPFTFFRILNAYDDGMFMYRWLYYTAVTELITGDKTIQPLTQE